MSRFETNLKIIEFINTDTDLKAYNGFGGLNKIMSKEQHQRLKNILGDVQYHEVMKSCKTAYYTPTKMIACIYQGLIKLGFKGGRILEPACGHGAFIFNMPISLIENSIIHAIELDRLSARIAKAICPYATILNNGFEKTRFKQNTFDAIIANPPYGSLALNDVQLHELNGMALHHFFVAKSVYLLKENGIMAMVLPQYCMDNLHDHARDIMSKFGSLIAAFRLPDCCFDNAKVTVDIIFYIKNKINNIAFENTQKITIKGQRLAINEYYINHPHHMLGELDTCNLYGRVGLTVKAKHDKSDLFQQLSDLVSKLPVCYPKSPTKEFDIHASIDQALEKLKQRQSNQTELQANITAFEIQKITYLKQRLKKQEQSTNELMEEINTTLANIK